MTSAFLGFSTVFILLILLIIIYRKKGKTLTRLERAVLIVGLSAGIVDLVAGLIYIFSVLLPNYPWSDIIIQIPIMPIIWFFSIVLIASITAKIFLHYKKPIEQSINKHYRKRLQKDIGLELTKEVTIKHVVLADQEKDIVLAQLTDKIIYDIYVGYRTLPTYGVYKIFDKLDSMKVGGIVFTVSQDDAEVIAKKMTELYNNKKYRKVPYRFFSLFI